MFVHVSVCLYCRTHYSAISSPFGKPEVSLEPYWHRHPIFQVSINFHAILAISAVFWANFNMLGIQMHILKLKTSLVVLGKAIGLKKEPKAQKNRPKASTRGQRPPEALRKSQNTGHMNAPVFQSFISYSNEY